MSHEAEHQYHQKAIDDDNAAREHGEHDGHQWTFNIHPGWYVAGGVILATIATWIWTLLEPGSS